MAKFLVLIYGDERTWAEAPAQWHEENGRRHGDFNAAAGAAVVGGHELAPTVAAVSVRAGQDGAAVVTDGPFLESKEVIGGYYLLDAADRDEAVRLAMQIPEATAAHGGVEVRPVA
jgi:hypothetical protein